MCIEYEIHGMGCSEMYNCCDCGIIDENGCGCAYCWSCNACEECLEEAK